MSPAPLDDEVQRELERRALRNVSWLAAKLGYGDALDRRTEKTLIVAIGAGLVLLVAAAVVSGVFKAKDDEKALAQRRCEVAAYVQVLPEMEQLVKSRRQDLAPDAQAALVRKYASDEARSRCEKGAPSK